MATFLSANRNDLFNSLAMITGIVDSKHTNEIFANVLLEKKNGQLFLVTTDKEIQITARVKGVTAENDESITVNARMLQDILSVLPAGNTVEFALEDKKLNIRCGKSRYSLQTLPGAEFPKVKEIEENTVRFELKNKELKKLFANTQYAMGKTEPRQFLNATLFSIENNELAVVATDGYRMAWASTPLSQEVAAQEVVLTRKTVVEINRLIAGALNSKPENPPECEGADSVVKVSVSGSDGKKQVRFEVDGVEMLSKVMDTNYPDYKPIIPTSTQFHLLFNRVEWLAALQRVAVVINNDQTSRSVCFNIDGNKATLTTNNKKNEDALEELAVQYEGKSPIELVYNLYYLLDVLKNVEGQTASLGFDDEKTTALLTIEGDPHFRYAIMPVRV